MNLPPPPHQACPALPCFCCLISLSYLNLLASITSNCRPFPLLTCSGAHSGLLHLIVSFGWYGHNTCRGFTVWFGRGRSSHLLPSHQHLRSGSSQPVPQGQAWWPLFCVHAFGITCVHKAKLWNLHVFARINEGFCLRSPVTLQYIFVPMQCVLGRWHAFNEMPMEASDSLVLTLDWLIYFLFFLLVPLSWHETYASWQQTIQQLWTNTLTKC